MFERKKKSSLSIEIKSFEESIEKILKNNRILQIIERIRFINNKNKNKLKQLWCIYMCERISNEKILHLS